jgi:voltage-gated potassium channel
VADQFVVASIFADHGDSLLLKLIYSGFGHLLSPTRWIADIVKAKKPDGGKNFILRWHWTFFLWSIFSCLLLYVIPSPALSVVGDSYPLRFYLWLVPFSRCNEIFYAFLRDAFDHLNGLPARTDFTPFERVKLATRSYLEVALDFGIVYFFLPSSWFSNAFRSIIHAVYFSGITMTTVGYGDIAPLQPFSQLLVLYEVVIGLVLAVITIAIYIGSNRPSRDG